MAQKRNVDCIWWLQVQPGEFYNIERHHQIKGGGGSLYIEIPKKIVPDTLNFLGMTRANLDALGEITIEARVAQEPSLAGPITFMPKSGGRMRIARQNRQQPNSQRHPAWTTRFEFPSAPDNVSTTEKARPYFPEGGLRIYIAKTVDGEYYTGFTKGGRPLDMEPDDPEWDLYSDERGGVIGAN